MANFEILDIRYYKNCTDYPDIKSITIYKYVTILVDGYKERVYLMHSVFFNDYKKKKWCWLHDFYKNIPDEVESEDFKAEEGGLYFELYQQIDEEEFDRIHKELYRLNFERMEYYKNIKSL